MAARAAQETLSASWLAARIAVEPLRLEAMRRAGELIAYRPPGASEHYYPIWQFDENWQPLPIVPRLVQEARRRGLRENRLYEVLTARSGIAGGRRVADALREGRSDHVLEAIRQAQA
jgi:hypothetical protein